MKLCRVDDIKEQDILARDVMIDKFNVLLYRDTVLHRNYIDKLIELGIEEVYIKDGVSEEKVAILKEDVESKCKTKVREVIQRHTYNRGDDMKEISEAADNIISNILEEEEVVENIYEIKERSADIYEHSISICSLATLISLKLGLDKDRVHDIGVGCLLHDLGLRYMTIGFQDVENLSDKEVAEYKKHPVYGYTALKNETWLSNKSKEIILCHHERLDGCGYPLHATEIPIEPRIVSVCDTFDEMICGIGYRRVKVYEAVEYLKAFKDVQFDGKIVDALLEFTAVYPSGSVVITNEKETAVVINQNKHFPERPVIKITMDKNGNSLKEEKIINLVEVKNVFIDSVLE